TAGTAVPAVTLGTFRVVIPTTYTVTNAADSGPGSLRDALTRANTLPGTVDTILFDPAFFAAPRTITLTSGELPVTDSVTIFGPGAALLTITGGVNSRLFNVNGPGRLGVSFIGMTLTGGNILSSFNSPITRGGAIFVQDETVTIAECVL